MEGRQPALGVLGQDHPVSRRDSGPARHRRLAVALLVVGLTASACSTGEQSSPAATSSAPGSSAPAASTVPTPDVVPAPPEAGACYRLSYGQAIAPTARAAAVSCAKSHTSMTFAVGTIGELIPKGWPEVDDPRVQQKVGDTCSRRFEEFVGGSVEDRLLSMFRPVWFTPTLEEAAAGAFWFRCDVVALHGHERLDPLRPGLKGILGRLGWRDRYGLCATAEPGTDAFARVSCGARHAWRALKTLPLAGRAYPGTAAVRRRGEAPCRAAARAVAADPLDYRWGYEWPTAEQWQGGQRYGVCWVPAEE